MFSFSLSLFSRGNRPTVDHSHCLLAIYTGMAVLDLCRGKNNIGFSLSLSLSLSNPPPRLAFCHQDRLAHCPATGWLSCNICLLPWPTIAIVLNSKTSLRQLFWRLLSSLYTTIFCCILFIWKIMLAEQGIWGLQFWSVLLAVLKCSSKMLYFQVNLTIRKTDFRTRPIEITYPLSHIHLMVHVKNSSFYKIKILNSHKCPALYKLALSRLMN